MSLTAGAKGLGAEAGDGGGCVFVLLSGPVSGARRGGARAASADESSDDGI